MSCRAIGAASRCSGRSRIFDSTRSNGARATISGARRSARVHRRDQRADAVEAGVGARGLHRARIDVGRQHRHAEAAWPRRSPARRSRCRGRGCGAAGDGAPARRAPAGSRAWCRDGRCRTRSRPRSRCRCNGSARGRGRARRARRSGRRVTGRSPIRLSFTQSRGATRSMPACSPADRRRPARSSRASSPRSGRVAEMHVDLPASVRPREGRADGLGRIEALGQEVGDAARRASSAMSRATKLPPAGDWVFGLWSQRFMHGAEAIFHRNYQPDIAQAYPPLIRPPRHIPGTLSTIRPQDAAWTATRPPAPS